MKIFITKKAKKGFDKIRDYIVEDFGELTAREFDKKVNDFIDLLEVFPELGHRSQGERNSRICNSKTNQSILPNKRP